MPDEAAETMANSLSADAAVRALAACLASLLTGGCAALPEGSAGSSLLPAGSTIELHRALDLPAGSARVYVQDGERVRWDDVDWWVPYCSFGLRRTSDEALVETIEPGVFTTGAESRWIDVASRPPRGIRVASTVALAVGRRPGGPGRYTYHTEIPLHAPAQPQVDDLTCAYDADDPERFLTREEIQGTLGELATLHPLGN